MKELKIVGNETRTCCDCGARIRNVPPEAVECIFCGGRLATPLEVWAK